MREITPEELELIAGFGYLTAPQTQTIQVIGTPLPSPAPSPVPSPPPAGGGGSPSPTPTPTPTPCVSALQSQVRVNATTIDSNESSTLRTTPYFPGGNSGATIGYGVDLGQNTAADLQSWGVSSAGITSLTPFFGLEGTAASSAISQHPNVTISTSDATSASNGAMNATISNITSNFNSDSSTVTFDQLPANTQTAITDVAYNMGVNLANVAPNFWSDITSGNFQAAVTELDNWNGPGNSTGRLEGDAALIQQDINAKNIPQTNSGYCKN